MLRVFLCVKKIGKRNSDLFDCFEVDEEIIIYLNNEIEKEKFKTYSRFNLYVDLKCHVE